MNKFNAQQYVEDVYGEQAIEDFQEVHGLNGLDRLWSCESKEEVDDLFANFID